MLPALRRSQFADFHDSWSDGRRTSADLQQPVPDAGVKFWEGRFVIATRVSISSPAWRFGPCLSIKPRNLADALPQ